MELWNELARYFSDAGSTRRMVLIGATLLGISSGVLGTFAVLRKQSLLGDAMAHAALPGICLAFLATGQKNLLILLIGATFTALISAMLIPLITRKSRLKNDAAIGIVLSVFFGGGLVLLTVIQKQGIAGQSGLDSFLFGKAASLLRQDIYIMTVMCVLLITMVALFYKELKLLSFDQQFGATLGFPMHALGYFLTFLIVISVMIGLQAVGVVLMVAMLILPASAARQWTEKLGYMIILSAIFGGLAGASGAVFSALAPKIPTGPVMVLASSCLLIYSLVLAPQRGLFPVWWKRQKNDHRIGQENTLKSIYRTYENKENWDSWLSVDLLSISFKRIKKLARAGLVEISDQGIRLTQNGRNKGAKILRTHRLWELYLQRKMDIAIDHVHRDADDIEHILSPEIIEQLEDVLDSPATDPHGKPIPAV